MVTLKLIGYWATPPQWHPPDDQPPWPDVRRAVRVGWLGSDRKRLITYLKSGHRAHGFLGHSACRFTCHDRYYFLGTYELTDGEWLWPVGLGHYVERHAVALPEEFVASVSARGWKVPPKNQILPKGRELIDDSTWRDWARQLPIDHSLWLDWAKRLPDVPTTTDSADPQALATICLVVRFPMIDEEEQCGEQFDAFNQDVWNMLRNGYGDVEFGVMLHYGQGGEQICQICAGDYADLEGITVERWDMLLTTLLDGLRRHGLVDQAEVIRIEPDPVDWHRDRESIVWSGSKVASLEIRAEPGPGKEIDEYKLLEEIGHGGHGVVYKAYDGQFDTTVALKILRSDMVTDDLVRRFHNDLAAGLDGRNIITVRRFGEFYGRPYYTMKLMDGNLDDFDGNQETAARLLVSVARAVHYLHERRILHRDLKPSNVLLDSVERPYVADFGLARRFFDSPQASILQRSLKPSNIVLDPEGQPPVCDFGLTKLVGAEGEAAGGDIVTTSMYAGTFEYMAPEQFEGVATRVSDVYGLGTILYKLLTGRPPFEERTPEDTKQKVLEELPARPRTLKSHVDRDLEAVCLMCLKKDPDERYRSAEGLAKRPRPGGGLAGIAFGGGAVGTDSLSG